MAAAKAVIDALEAVIAANGGKIHTKTEVSKILVENGRAAGVIVGDKTYEADLVISNLGHAATACLCSEALPEKTYSSYLRMLETLKPSAGIKICLAADEPLVGHSGVLLTPYAKRVNGINEVTHVDPKLAPPGKHLTMSHQYVAPENVKNLEAEIELGLNDLKEIFPGKKYEVLLIQSYHDNWPVNRAASGTDPGNETPIPKLYVVGDGAKGKGGIEVEGVALGVAATMKKILLRKAKKLQEIKSKLNRCFIIPPENSHFVTYSKNVFIPITNICRNHCAYCGFKREPGQPGARLMKPEEIIPILENGVKAGCTEALFTFGEYAEEVPEYREWLKELGYSSTLEYLLFLCETAIDIGILPHTNAGIMTRSELEALKPLNASMGLMLESTAILDAHKDCPGKVPELRLDTIREAGKLQIPYTTGLLVGIGEKREDRIESLEAIAGLHREYGHIQEVIIQNFAPKPGTPMENFPEPTIEEMVDTVSLARQILPPDVAVQVAPNLIDPKALISKGVTDLGGISPLTIDWINPEAEWPDVKDLQEKLGNIQLRERLPIYPQYVKRGWYSDRIGRLIKQLSDREGYRKQP